MPDGQIFKATYSGIPVYEMMCKGVAVMRRRSDSWLNATQILKVAGFDKPQRTRILEREVQKGEHEKVQGGYGKYQGTWIPLDRGLALCKQYNCEHLLLPIIDFQPDTSSPPLAPKHVVAPTPTKPPPRRAEPPPATSTINTRSSRRVVQDAPPEEVSEAESSSSSSSSARGSEDGSMTPTPSASSSRSRTPSPIRSVRSSPIPSMTLDNMDDDFRSPSPTAPGRKRKHHELDDSDTEADIPLSRGLDASSFGDQILEYFISDTAQIPSVLITPPADFDPDMAIDDDGHTALHWAAAMGRIRIVKLLLTAGADIFRVNKSGQTPLMRSVMFANNYDVRKFSELYELLHRSTLNIDHNNRTLFHHIVDVAMSKGKTHAARYYMEIVLNRLADYPRELADVINFQDEDGETALTLAARCRSKRLVKILIDHGADPKICNRDGKSTEDYILEDERFRSSPIIPSRGTTMSFRNAQAAQVPHASNLEYPTPEGERPPLHYSVTAQKAATRCVNDITSLLESLASAYDQELRDKERDMTQATALLANIQTEILDTRQASRSLRSQYSSIESAKANMHRLEIELRAKMGSRYRLGWEQWVKEDEEREKTIRDAYNGEIPSSLAEDMTTLRAPNGEDVSDLVELHSDIPSDPHALEEMCNALRGEIAVRKERRLDLFDELIRHMTDSGTSGKMVEYRRLISAGCGGLSSGEVDNAIGMLLETLESEDPSSSSSSSTLQPAWTSPTKSAPSSSASG